MYEEKRRSPPSTICQPEIVFDLANFFDMKPYQQIPILECNEPLVPIPFDQFAVQQPHPYMHLGAPYGQRSPYYLRQGVVARLVHAQAQLQTQYPHWRIQIFDGYRPVAVQQFMVNHAFAELVRSQGLSPQALTQQQKEEFLRQVYQFWAVPNSNPATPPPHSTGAAVDVTLVNADGQAVDMGSQIDEISPRSHPDYYAITATDAPDAAQFHHHRTLLNQIMASAGFLRHPNEWWHFSFGDQMWAWLKNKDSMDTMIVARYGGV
ncbi:M15 family metallopeptidase [Leptolyngbya sp. AN02str]|uniref:M15 family metallopeptidase n=1 Tax=Leptolyngbya sp. AN02str TaxID=3423363 RepID=UPI003D31050F